MSLHKEHIIKLSNSDEEYKLIIKVENNDNFVQFHLNNNKNTIKENYFLKLTLEELVQLNKYFLFFDTIFDCANNISNIIKDCTPKLVKSDKSMLLCFSIFLPGQEKREIQLNLEEKPFDSIDIIEELKKEINILKTKINDLEISINKKDAMYDALNCKYDQLKNDYDLTTKQFQTELINIKSMLPNNNNSNNINPNPLLQTFQELSEINKDEQSTIINSPLEINLISNKIRLLYPGKNVIYNILYRKSRDSDKVNIFHSKCDKIRGTLILIKTVQGYKFGGYVNENWEGDNIVKKDNTAFIFSLNYNKIYDIKNNKNAIYCNPNYGPTFCGNREATLLIKDINEGECCMSVDSNYENYKDDFEINGGQKRFKVSELEVFKVTLVS